jgi:hypothetical protein
MPTLPDLGKHVAAWLRESPFISLIPRPAREIVLEGSLPGGDLETWLSSLAERQPYMSEAQSSMNHALFLETTRMIVDLIQERQRNFWEHSPPWLHHLLRIWHRHRVSVITLNYDTIIEGALLQLDAPRTHGTTSEILHNLPRPALPVLGGSSPASTFHLIKLHGSVDWFWNPGDASGDSLCRVPPGATESDRAAALAGKEPFIIPPLATKGPFYSLSLIRNRWQEAATALSEARRIFVLGYSVPLNDLAVVSMLTHNVEARAQWHVANPDPLVADRIRRVGYERYNVQRYPSIKNFVGWYENEACKTMTKTVATEFEANRLPDGAPIMVCLSRSERGIVRHLEDSYDELVLDAVGGHEKCTEMGTKSAQVSGVSQP